jgi:hypothetical protein
MVKGEKMLYLDATAIREWLSCRENYRQGFVLNRRSKQTAIHREFGIALHLGVEDFWSGQDFASALARVMEYLNNVHLFGLTPDAMRKWDEMVKYAPDMLACYYDSVEYDPTRILFVEHPVLCESQAAQWVSSRSLPMIEHEWKAEYQDVTLCGRIDRCEVGPRLVDLKTASEIGKTWKADYKQSMLRDVGLALYDWYLCQIGHAPTMVTLEVLVKPYRDKPPRFTTIDMPEIIAYRKRFEAQLKWIVREIAHYHEHYLQANPWPMSQGACNGKFGACQFLGLCNGGENEKTLKGYGPRREHLDIRVEALNG